MDGNSIVPKGASPGGPLETDLNIYVTFIDIVQVVQDEIALSLVEANDRFRHGSIDPKGFPTSGWMHPNDWVDAFDVLRAGLGIVAVEVFVGAHVDGLSPINDLTEFRRQL